MGTRILASTNAHKREPLATTLEAFARLGLLDLDVNLHHFLEAGEDASAAAAALTAAGLRVGMASGGWCDFFHRQPDVERTFVSVARQVDLARTLGVASLRLFFGRLARADYSPAALEIIVTNLQRLATAHPHMLFVFENHDGASLDPQVCHDVLDRVARKNIRMNFDPINFAKAGVQPMTALDVLRPFVAHTHLKGLDRGQYCEFGAGDVDLVPVLGSLVDGGYRGSFTVEYEGPFDGTLRLYQSVARALAWLDAQRPRSFNQA